MQDIVSYWLMDDRGGEREKSYWSLGRLNNLLFSIRRYYIIM